MNRCLSRFRIFRFLKGGIWIKTVKRGWITGEQYDEYINARFDPISLIKDYDKTRAGELHAARRVYMSMTYEIERAFEKYEPEISEDLHITIHPDEYDNSIIIEMSTPGDHLRYPYEPSKKVRDVVYAFGFDMVHWRFKDYRDEIRGWEPRRSMQTHKYFKTEYGYVDDRFNEAEWKKKYGYRFKEI